MKKSENKIDKKKIDAIQGSRFLLFLNLFLFHTTAFSVVGEFNVKDTEAYKLFLSGSGIQAVTFFIVLSGFIMGIHKVEKWNRGGV